MARRPGPRTGRRSRPDADHARSPDRRASRRPRRCCRTTGRAAARRRGPRRRLAGRRPHGQVPSTAPARHHPQAAADLRGRHRCLGPSRCRTTPGRNRCPPRRCLGRSRHPPGRRCRDTSGRDPRIRCRGRSRTTTSCRDARRRSRRRSRSARRLAAGGGPSRRIRRSRRDRRDHGLRPAAAGRANRGRVVPGRRPARAGPGHRATTHRRRRAGAIVATDRRSSPRSRAPFGETLLAGRGPGEVADRLDRLRRRHATRSRQSRPRRPPGPPPSARSVGNGADEGGRGRRRGLGNRGRSAVAPGVTATVGAALVPGTCRRRGGAGGRGKLVERRRLLVDGGEPRPRHHGHRCPGRESDPPAGPRHR